MILIRIHSQLSAAYHMFRSLLLHIQCIAGLRFNLLNSLKATLHGSVNPAGDAISVMINLVTR